MSFPRWRIDLFLVAMVLVTALAWLFPGPGASGGWMHPELVTKAGVALIFLLHGLNLSFAALRAGVLNWRLHVFVQVFTYLVFPALGWIGWKALGGSVGSEMLLGFFFLCALPSTVSSSVAMTAAARGNVAGAVFNATLSSLLGILVTPLWMAWVMRTSGTALPLGPVVVDLLRWLVLPLVIGQILRPWLGAWIGRHKARIGLVDRATILLLVYTSFCDSFQQRIWSGGGQVILMGAVCFALFAVVMLLTTWASRAVGLSREDRIAAIFCGSKKTLASGVPMAKVIFGAHPGLGLILLAIMIYHPLQLVVCGVLAERWGREV